MSDCNCSICKEMDNYIETKSDSECPICFEAISSEINTVITECGHKFHCKCLMQNAMHNGFGCPYCRTNMVNKPKPEFINVVEQNYENINENENIELELEEGEIVRTDFEEFVDREFYADKIRGKYFVLTAFRMFHQRIEGEEPDEYTEEELDDLEANIETRSLLRSIKESNAIVQSILNKNISKEDLIKSMLYGSFGHALHQETYFKIFGKVKASIIGKVKNAQENRTIRIDF